ncbi:MULTISPECIES: methyltransferase domain-containing protein [Thioalkalivibrio]|uniref:SAM-dependent methyltransferase n=1 Tax=Thioalkalivibrio halophilus TaxID=252474 RepID=A0A1V3A1U5_9GAMM|nr:MULTISPECIES: methyltransferase domain-containing protein [Thioalkalivibrio]OOC11305.1 SAM-dependent methyltransferase [Thioalkalivibrio halophilus]PYG01488.1 sarcosine/dimethylglycine N-methyltransferase [Thioalkalivibrio sp. ALE21]
MSQEYSDVVETARDYYNSADADTFYKMVWGGEDLHIGLYEYQDEPIGDASRRTVAHMADLLGEPQPEWRVIDMGAGYGGVARYLVENYGCDVTALNLSEKENERDREINKARKLDHKITVVDGSFEKVDEPDATYDVVWSEDSFLHSPNEDKYKVIQEAARLLKPGGWLIFTDPMQTDDCPGGVLDPILARIHLDSLASPSLYRDAAQKAGLREIGFEEHSGQISTHYGRVKQELESREDELKRFISQDYMDRMKQGLQHWVDGGNSGYLTWGIFRFRKPD